jgi:hypothetical protein
MSDEQQYGLEAEQAAHGMHSIPEPSPAPDVGGNADIPSDSSTLHEAGEYLDKNRTEEPEWVKAQTSEPRHVDYWDEDAARRGERIAYDPKGTVSLERAADDLRRMRETEGQQHVENIKELVRDSVDKVRGHKPMDAGQQQTQQQHGYQQAYQTQEPAYQNRQASPLDAPYTPEQVVQSGRTAVASSAATESD